MTLPINLLRMLAGVLLLGVLHVADAAGPTIAGQELGKSTWETRAQLTLHHIQFTELPTLEATNGPSLHFQGRLTGKFSGFAQFLYDETHTLAAADLSVKDKDAKKFASLLRQQLEHSRSTSTGRAASANAPLTRWQIFDLGVDLNHPGNTVIRVSTPAFDALLRTSIPQGFHITQSGQVALAILGVLAIAGLVATLFKIRKAPSSVQHYVWASMPASAYLYWVFHTTLFARGLDWIGVSIGLVFWLAYLLTATWAIRTTATSGWLPRMRWLEGASALVAAPLLLIPAILRNCWKSAHYTGLVLFVGELLGAEYYFLHHSPFWLMMLVPTTGLIGGGLVRLYAAVYNGTSYIVKPDWPAVRAGISVILWPLHLIYYAVMLVLFALATAIGFWWLIAIACILGAIFSVWVGILVVALIFVPLLFNVVMMGTLPTGYCGMDFNSGNFSSGAALPDMTSFDSMAFNPANGLPMIGGMGGLDVHGNSFGSNFNDPF